MSTHHTQAQVSPSKREAFCFTDGDLLLTGPVEAEITASLCNSGLMAWNDTACTCSDPAPNEASKKVNKNRTWTTL